MNEDIVAVPSSGARMLRLQWSGERIPQPGERVLLTADKDPETELCDFGVVVGYFQAHGWLGVKLRMEDGQVLGVFGTEMMADPIPVVVPSSGARMLKQEGAAQ